MSKTIVFETENYEVVEIHKHSYLARKKEDAPQTIHDEEKGEYFDTVDEAIESLPESN